MKILLAFCALAAAASLPNSEQQSPPHTVTISFAEEVSGQNFAINIPADQRRYNVQYLSHGVHHGGGPLLATSAQLTSELSQGTSCVINFEGRTIATLDTRHSFAWLHESAYRHAPVHVDRATIMCRT